MSLTWFVRGGPRPLEFSCLWVFYEGAVVGDPGPRQGQPPGSWSPFTAGAVGSPAIGFLWVPCVWTVGARERAVRGLRGIVWTRRVGPAQNQAPRAAGLRVPSCVLCAHGHPGKPSPLVQCSPWKLEMLESVVSRALITSHVQGVLPWAARQRPWCRRVMALLYGPGAGSAQMDRPPEALLEGWAPRFASFRV